MALPQSRNTTFQSNLFAGYQRSEKAFISCLQEMVIQGVSTRKVSKITEELCGVHFSKSQVSEICKTLDEEVNQWLNRPLVLKYPYVYVDAMYEKIRENHRIESHGVLIVVGVSEAGYREILSVEVANTENETNWGEFISRLKNRGLSEVNLIISDAHKGLKAAIVQYFQGCQWQRCQVHFKKNVMDKLRAKDKGWIKEQLNDIFGVPDKITALGRINQLVLEIEGKYPELADTLEEDT